MFTKDPTKLRCPKCSGIVDSGHTWETVKRITKSGLFCEHCGVALNKVSKNHWSVLPLPIFFIIDFFADLQESYATGLGFLAMAITFALIARETVSTKLEVKDEDKLEWTCEFLDRID